MIDTGVGTDIAAVVTSSPTSPAAETTEGCAETTACAPAGTVRSHVHGEARLDLLRHRIITQETRDLGPETQGY